MELQLVCQGLVILVIMEILTDFLGPFQTTDMTLTEMLRADIFSKVEHKTNKQRRTALFLSIHL